VLAFVLSLFGARLVQLQGLDAPTYAAEAEQGRLRTVTLPAARGTITDRNGIALATTVAAVNVTSDQTKVVDQAATAAVLAPVLKLDPTVLQEKLTGDARFFYLAKAVTPATWRTISTLDHPDPERGVEEPETSHLARLFLCRGDVAEAPPRRPAGIGARERPARRMLALHRLE